MPPVIYADTFIELEIKDWLAITMPLQASLSQNSTIPTSVTSLGQTIFVDAKLPLNSGYTPSLVLCSYQDVDLQLITSENIQKIQVADFTYYYLHPLPAFQEDIEFSVRVLDPHNLLMGCSRISNGFQTIPVTKTSSITSANLRTHHYVRAKFPSGFAMTLFNNGHTEKVPLLEYGNSMSSARQPPSSGTSGSYGNQGGTRPIPNGKTDQKSHDKNEKGDKPGGNGGNDPDASEDSFDQMQTFDIEEAVEMLESLLEDEDEDEISILAEEIFSVYESIPPFYNDFWWDYDIDTAELYSAHGWVDILYWLAQNKWGIRKFIEDYVAPYPAYALPFMEALRSAMKRTDDIMEEQFKKQPDKKDS